MKTVQKFRNNRITGLADFSGLCCTYLFSLQFPRQILPVDELGRVRRTGFLPIIFSAYLADLSVDTTVLWQFKRCNIRTSWNRLRAFINHMKTTCRRRGRRSSDKKMVVNICSASLKAGARILSAWLQNCKHCHGIWESSPCRILEIERILH